MAHNTLPVDFYSKCNILVKRETKVFSSIFSLYKFVIYCYYQGTCNLKNFDFVNCTTLGNRNVKHVCVKGNHYDPNSDNSLAEMLSSSSTITELDISGCQLRGK